MIFPSHMKVYFVEVINIQVVENMKISNNLTTWYWRILWKNETETLFISISQIDQHYFCGDLFTGFISFLLPWSLPAAAKKNISCWKENMKTSLNVNVQRRHWGKKCPRSYWRWYFYQCNDDVEISYLFPTSICFVCLQSNAVFAVKDQNCLDLRNLGLQTFHSWSQEIQKTTNAKNVAIHWKYTALYL